MKILVTGGTGLLGARLISRLVGTGHDVFALGRSESSYGRLLKMGAYPVMGDLENGMPFSLPSIDAVVHAAAVFRFAGPRAPYFRTNVDGTVALLKASQRAGAKTFLYVSAAGIVMDDKGTPVRNVDERAPTYPASLSAYTASKAQGESAVLAANSAGFRTVALRPSALWGPGDKFSGELSHAIASKEFAFIDRGEYPVSTCHVENAVEAVVCALERGSGGHAYFVNDQEKWTFRQFVRAIARTQGVSIEKIRSIPYRLAYVIGGFMELFFYLKHDQGDPMLSRAMVRMIGKEFRTNDEAARRELGYIGKTSHADGLRMYTVANSHVE